MELKEILLVDGKAPISSAISFILQSHGYLIMLAPDAETASEDMGNYCFDLMLVYLNGYERDKLDLLRQTNRRCPQTKVMIVANPRKNDLTPRGVSDGGGRIPACAFQRAGTVPASRPLSPSKLRFSHLKLFLKDGEV